eukprot:TRINITY_DN24156_c0_g1_i1.p1 TRINITY_DN24156_c0_g1~~TRINITY_DN24156_c0_g1_i1.p1  ORF type:complete len:131 (+),score=40.11 TRINITY_DN24156_c0_g1_i1:158-550(+)
MLGFILSPILYLIVMLYAPLMSVRAVKTPGTEDDKQWLTFWVIWSVLCTVESFTFGLLFIIPLYSELRFALVIFLIFFNGGRMAFDMLIEPAYAMVQKYVTEEQMQMLEKDPKGFAMGLYQKNAGGNKGN